MMRQWIGGIAGLGLLFLAGAGCVSSSQSQNQQPAVASLTTKILSKAMPSLDPASPTSQSINAQITLLKGSLFNQQWVYGLDLQYSSQVDKTLDLYTQSLAMGHWVASFVVNGDELQLIADMKDQFPSDVNHPEQLISRFKILSQDENTITVAQADSTNFIAQQFMQNNPEPGTDPNAQANYSVLDHWVRSFNYAADGNYLLQESSIELLDGTRAEVMETVFPHATLTPGKDFKQFKMSADPSSLTGAGPDSPPEVSRFRFLAGPDVYTLEDNHAWAQHFDLTAHADGTPAVIQWYVTPNIPDQYLEPVQEAVEGWNRYFRSYKGFQRDVVKFMGRLPDGVKIGDPRYNVINWDSRQIAGAAYESQDSDPDTGMQSHSLIYMPAAWVFIGTKYWTNGIGSEWPNGAGPVNAPSAKASSFGSALSKKANCTEMLSDTAMLAASGAMSPDAVQTFGVEILKQTLFHEVGHSLGLAHNFKAYTSWKPNDPSTPTLFSTSIMAYNDYEIERAAFSALHSSDGPLLEYDRQVLSAIYDQGQDIQSTDAVEPACADAEADNQQGGVDPICIRYANEWDPTMSVSDAYSRIVNATMPNTTPENATTLVQALANVPAIALPDAAIAQVKTADDLAKAGQALAKQINGSMSFYIVSGKRSLDYTLRLNVKSLYEFENGILPAQYDELGMRERSFTGVQEAVGMTALPQNVSAAAAAAIDAGIARLQQSPAMTAMTGLAASSAQAKLKSDITNAVNAFASDDQIGLVKLRLAIIGALARQSAVPFYLGTLGQGTAATNLDYEHAVVGLLADIVVNSNGDSARTAEERIAAATALATYKNRDTDQDAISAITKTVQAQLAAATSNANREMLESISSALGI